jgi:hypothetical protein
LQEAVQNIVHPNDHAADSPAPRKGSARPLDWVDVLRQRPTTEGELRQAAKELVQAKRQDQAAALLKAGLQTFAAKPWMYSALALALQMEGASDAEVRQALTSPIDWAPNRLETRLGVAEALSAAGQTRAGLALLRESADRFPGSVKAAPIRRESVPPPITLPRFGQPVLTHARASRSR